jgi:hypothetical protein
VLGPHDDVTDGSLLLSNNFMSDGGKHYAACAAVFAGYVFDTQITQNTITDFSCAPPPPPTLRPPPPPLPNVCFADSSISVGWGWGGSKFLGSCMSTFFSRIKLVTLWPGTATTTYHSIACSGS